MEPTLSGPRVIGDCDHCRRPFSLAEEIAHRVSVLRCPHCNEPLPTIDSLDQTPGQSVWLEQITKSTQLCRGELIVFDDEMSSSALHSLQESAVNGTGASGEQSRQIKRLVGFPGESILISEGDLFVNSRRFKKSASNFIRSAIHVSAWPEAIDSINDPATKSPFVIYQSTSLWPRTSAKTPRHPSPVLDELPVNADELFEFVPVHDIGIVMEFERYPTADTAMTIGIWSRGFLRSVDMRFGNRCCTVVPNDQQQTSFSATLCYELGKTDAKLDSIRMLVAVVDGRLLLASLDRQDRVVSSADWDLCQCLDNGHRFTGGGVSAVRPIVISVRDGNPRLTSIEVIRDIHYRGPRGESDFALPIVNAIHVLGDNVSISSDSRSELAAGIDRRLITGRVVPPKR